MDVNLKTAKTLASKKFALYLVEKYGQHRAAFTFDEIIQSLKEYEKAQDGKRDK